MDEEKRKEIQQTTTDVFINLFTDKYKRIKARVYAILFICLPLWIAVSSYNGIQKSDIGWGIFLVALAVVFCDIGQKYSLQIKKLKNDKNTKNK